MKIQKALSILQLLVGVMMGLFTAGIAIPSLLRSVIASNHLGAGSLHTFTAARLTFSYTFENLAFAILGGLCGAALALIIDSPDTLANAGRILRRLRHAHPYRRDRAQVYPHSPGLGLAILNSFSGRISEHL